MTKRKNTKGLAGVTVTKVNRRILAVSAKSTGAEIYDQAAKAIKAAKPPTKAELRAKAKNERRLVILVSMANHLMEQAFPRLINDLVRCLSNAGMFVAHDEAAKILEAQMGEHLRRRKDGHGLPIIQGSRVPPHPGGEGPAQPALYDRGASPARDPRSAGPLFR